MVRKFDDSYFATLHCPHDCPFRDKLDTGIMFCSYSIYSVRLDQNRRTRTEISPEGTVNYHIPPDCDIYEKYKDKSDEIQKVKKDYDRYYLERRIKEAMDRELYVTAKRDYGFSRKR